MVEVCIRSLLCVFYILSWMVREITSSCCSLLSLLKLTAYPLIRIVSWGYDGMFSQGEWQLLSIARAAAANPAILLLDEITANLDAATESRVIEALRRASEGRTVLSISRRIYENLGGKTIEIKS